MDDMFGEVPQPDPGPPPPQRSPLTVDDVREQMVEIVATLHEATAMPFEPRELQSHKAMFPIMAQWLPEADGEALLRVFRKELGRFE